MEKVFMFLVPGTWPKKYAHSMFIAVCGITATFAVSQTIMFKEHMNEARPIEGTLDGIKKGEVCRVVRTDYFADSKKAETNIQVRCSVTGNHLLRGTETPPQYFKKIPSGIVPILPEDHDVRRLL